MTVAVVLTVGTVVFIIAHLDHLAGGLQVGEVARGIAQEGEEVITAMPEQTRDEVPAAAGTGCSDGDGFEVAAPHDGWVTRAAADRMLAAVPPGSTVRLETRSGAYIHEGEPLVTVWPAPGNPDEVRNHPSATVMVPAYRTMQQDVDFALRQLVDIGLRALSSAANDSTTAVEVTLRVGSQLRKLLAVDLPPEAVAAGPEGRVLLRPWQLTHAEYIAHVFDQLRRAAPPQPQVVAALLRVLRMLVDHVQRIGRTEHVPALHRQLQLLLQLLPTTPGLHSDDVERLRVMADDSTDPPTTAVATSVTRLRRPGSAPPPLGTGRTGSPSDAAVLSCPSGSATALRLDAARPSARTPSYGCRPACGTRAVRSGPLRSAPGPVVTAESRPRDPCR